MFNENGANVILDVEYLLEWSKRYFEKIIRYNVVYNEIIIYNFLKLSLRYLKWFHIQFTSYISYFSIYYLCSFASAFLDNCSAKQR
jgi:hypothetical protein